MDLNSNFVIIVLFHNTHALLVLNIKNWQNIFTWQIHTQTKPISKWRLHTILLDSEFKNTKLITTTNNSIIIITFVIYHYQRHHQHQQHYHDQELATKLESAPSELFTRLFPDIQDCTVEKVCRTPPSPPLSSSPPLSLHRREGLPNTTITTAIIITTIITAPSRRFAEASSINNQERKYDQTYLSLWYKVTHIDHCRHFFTYQDCKVPTRPMTRSRSWRARLEPCSDFVTFIICHIFYLKFKAGGTG